MPEQPLRFGAEFALGLVLHSVPCECVPRLHVCPHDVLNPFGGFNTSPYVCMRVISLTLFLFGPTLEQQQLRVQNVRVLVLTVCVIFFVSHLVWAQLGAAAVESANLFVICDIIDPHPVLGPLIGGSSRCEGTYISCADMRHGSLKADSTAVCRVVVSVVSCLKGLTT